MPESNTPLNSGTSSVTGSSANDNKRKDPPDIHEGSNKLTKIEGQAQRHPAMAVGESPQPPRMEDPNKHLQHLFKKAEKKLHENDFPATIGITTHILTLGHFPYALAFRAQAHKSLGNYHPALQDIARALHTATHLDLKVNLYAIQVEVYYLQKNYENAIEVAKKTLSLNANTNKTNLITQILIESQIEYAILLFKKDLFTQSLALLDEIEKHILVPHQKYRAHATRINIYEKLKQWEKVAENCRAVLECNPNDKNLINLYSRLVNAQIHLNNLEQAKTYSITANTVKPNDAGILGNLATIYALMGEETQAEKHATLAVIASTDATQWYNPKHNTGNNLPKQNISTTYEISISANVSTLIMLRFSLPALNAGPNILYFIALPKKPTFYEPPSNINTIDELLTYLHSLVRQAYRVNGASNPDTIEDVYNEEQQTALTVASDRAFDILQQLFSIRIDFPEMGTLDLITTLFRMGNMIQKQKLVNILDSFDEREFEQALATPFLTKIHGNTLPIYMAQFSALLPSLVGWLEKIALRNPLYLIDLIFNKDDENQLPLIFHLHTNTKDEKISDKIHNWFFKIAFPILPLEVVLQILTNRFNETGILITRFIGQSIRHKISFKNHNLHEEISNNTYNKHLVYLIPNNTRCSAELYCPPSIFTNIFFLLTLPKAIFYFKNNPDRFLLLFTNKDTAEFTFAMYAMIYGDANSKKTFTDLLFNADVKMLLQGNPEVIRQSLENADPIENKSLYQMLQEYWGNSTMQEWIATVLPGYNELAAPTLTWNSPSIPKIK